MVLIASPLALFLTPFLLISVNALKFSVKQVKKAEPLLTRSLPLSPVLKRDDNDIDLSTVHDLLYMANATVGGQSYVFQLDTGSSDLWVKHNPSPLPNSKQTSLKYNITYGIGWVAGTISTADVRFAGINVSNQAYLDVETAQYPGLSYGADGLMGLGFTSLSSIDHQVNNTGESYGRSLLYNMFRDNPAEPNFIAFSLQRTTSQGDDDIEGTFAIGEYEPKYQTIAASPKIPTWPVHDPSRWNVLLDAVLFAGGKTIIPTTTVPDVPGNKAVVLLDSGTSWTYAPTEICQAIYGDVQGAYLDSALGQWIVPCDAEIDIALQIGGQVFPVHPVDLIPKDTTNPSRCVGSFVPQSLSIGPGQFDWLVGDNFLRSVYSVHDFGDFDANNKMGDPYVQLLSLVNPDQASKDFVKARGGTAKTGITYSASNETMAAPSSTSVTLSADVANTIAKIGQFFPAILGLVALNALVLLALIILAIVLLCRKKKKRNTRKLDSTARTPLGRMSPMPLTRPTSAVNNELESAPHTYEPVSMALTEDTFVPPSPGFRKYDGSRPKSYATSVRSRKDSMQIDNSHSEDAVFGPPSPVFREFQEGTSSRPASTLVPLVPVSTYQRLEDDAEERVEPFTPPRAAFLRAPSTTKGDRPMSVGILPSQQSPQASKDAPFSRSQENLHQGRQEQPPPTEEDIAFTSPRPAFFAENANLRPGAGPPSGMRPSSMA
ncbi:acid protease [Marasmius fiardii PR-910]|nr:acid protease [Marasmius fiardii PR-910]